MAQPKMRISDLVQGLQGGGAIPPAPPDLGGAAPIGGPAMGAPLGAGALPPAPSMPSPPPARPKRGGGKRKKGKGGGGY